MVPFHTYINQRCRAAIAALSASQGDEVYCLLFLVYYLGNDPRLPQVRLVAPTRKDVGGPVTDNSGIKAAYTERRDIAAWFNDAVLITPDDEAERARWDAWLATLDLSPQDTPFGPTDPVSDHINQLFFDVANDLHDSGFMRAQFGTLVPILIVQFDRYDVLVRYAEHAPPPDGTSWTRRNRPRGRIRAGILS